MRTQLPVLPTRRAVGGDPCRTSQLRNITIWWSSHKESVRTRVQDFVIGPIGKGGIDFGRKRVFCICYCHVLVSPLIALYIWKEEPNGNHHAYDVKDGNIQLVRPPPVMHLLVWRTWLGICFWFIRAFGLRLHFSLSEGTHVCFSMMANKRIRILDI